MVTIASDYADTPIEDLGLRHRIYKLLCSYGVHTVGDLFTIPEVVVLPYLDILIEAIERVKRGHTPPAYI